MKGRTILIVLIIVLLIGSGGIYLFMRSQSGSSEASSSTDSTIDAVAIMSEGDGSEAVVAPATPLPAMVDVVVSNQTFQRGYYITDADVNPPPGQLPNITIEQRVATSVNDNVITDLADVIGKFARSDVFQGQTFTIDMLADDPRVAGTEKYGPSSLIPQGQVAAALPFDRLAGVAYGLSEGDYIDIMLTFNFYQIDEEFQTYLQNSAVFYLQEEITSGGDSTEGGGDAVTETRPDIMMLSPYGRFEQLPTGDTAHIYPSENQRPIVVSMVLQNAKVIQVGDWSPRESAQVATPTPTPLPADEPTPTPDFAAQAASTPVPLPPDVILLALSPQQQLLLKYAVESYADIDYALRQPNNGQLYNIDAVDLDYMLAQFNIELPPTYNYSVDSPLPTPQATAETIEDTSASGE